MVSFVARHFSTSDSNCYTTLCTRASTRHLLTMIYFLEYHTDTFHRVKLLAQNGRIGRPHLILEDFVVRSHLAHLGGDTILQHQLPCQGRRTRGFDGNVVLQIVRGHDQVLEQQPARLVVLIKARVDGQTQVRKARSHKRHAIGKVKDAELGDDILGNVNEVDVIVGFGRNQDVRLGKFEGLGEGLFGLVGLGNGSVQSVQNESSFRAGELKNHLEQST